MVSPCYYAYLIYICAPLGVYLTAHLSTRLGTRFLHRPQLLTARVPTLLSLASCDMFNDMGITPQHTCGACGRLFVGIGPLNYHIRSCRSEKRRLQGALSKVQQLWQEKFSNKRRKLNSRLEPLQDTHTLPVTTNFHIQEHSMSLTAPALVSSTRS